MTYTNQQNQAIQEFHNFLTSETNIFILRGSAGSGKTTLLKEFINIADDKNYNSILMAPTGRAALVLGEKTDRTTSTIHRMIYALEQSPTKENNRWVFKLRENNDSYRSVYFIDESSLIADVSQNNESFVFGSGQLLKDLIEYIKPSSGRKIVFTGDYAQLPPVNQNISPALSLEYLVSTYNVSISEFTLNEVLRQDKDSGILLNTQAIREAIDSKTFNTFRLQEHSDIKSIKDGVFIQTYIQDAKSFDTKETIVITQSNSKAKSYNDEIRETRYGTHSKLIERMDRLLICRNNYGSDVDLYNGTIITVKDYGVIETHEYFIGKERGEISFQKITFDYDGRNIERFVLLDFLTNQEGSISQELSKALYAEFDYRIHKTYKDITKQELSKQLFKDHYFNALQCKYGYAITCHKSQGGEWNCVFIDLDTCGGKTNETFFRWAYTALTRAKLKIWHINSPNITAIDQFEKRPIQAINGDKNKYYCTSLNSAQESVSKRINQDSAITDISVTDNLNIQYQHRFLFTRENESCELTLWFNSIGYTGKLQIIKSTNEKLCNTVKNICKNALTPTEIPFKPDFDAQLQMYNHIKDIISYTDIKLTNIEKKQWSDVYHLETSTSDAILEIFFNAKHIYTYAQPRCTNGNNDHEFNTLIEHL